MGRSLILESAFLRDLERTHRRGVAGGALEFLEANQDARLYLPFVVAGEIAAGISMRDRNRWEAFLAPYYVLPLTLEVSWQYGRAFRHLRDNRIPIDRSDLWIAATGLAYEMPVVTRRVEHFKRVPGLEVESY
ncbi:MAG: type II toxin-antitoxin system VapC family toxin [Acidobacteriota bacterium]|nr:type II toxin-antitoxin system VapC family toxin [Acidobacteriota bacterium]